MIKKIILSSLVAGALCVSANAAEKYVAIQGTSIGDKAVDNKTQTTGGISIDTRISAFDKTEAYISLDMSTNGDAGLITGLVGAIYNAYDQVYVGGGVGFAAINAHSVNQMVGAAEVKAEYQIDKKYVIGYKHGWMMDVEPYYNSVSHPTEQDTVGYDTIYVGMKF